MMISDFLQYIQTHRLCNTSDRILMGLSGGIDSMVMGSLFLAGGFNVGIAHCNFSLRGNDSDEDENFIRRFADLHGIPVFISRFDTETYAETHGISIQMAARDLRYPWFEEVRQHNDFDYIALAHQLDDSIETTIFNLARGTGLRGLSGIPSVAGKIIRPLLFTGREMIAAYAEAQGIEWREDRSNKNIKYRRNFIRHRIIPGFEQINPGFRNTMVTTLERLEGIRQFVNNYLESEKKNYLSGNGGDLCIKKEFIQSAGHPVLLAEIISGFGFNYDQAKEIYHRMQSVSGKIFYSPSHVLNIDRDHLIVSVKDIKFPEEIRIDSWNGKISRADGSMTFREMKFTDQIPGKEKDTVYLDADSISLPLIWRAWKLGDWFVPLGMTGKKKLSDFMIDKKIPVNLKRKISVLLSGENIIWVVGHRIDERYKITKSTRRIIRVKFESSDD